MNKLNCLIIFVMLTVTLMAQHESRDLPKFSGVDASAGVQVYLQEGQSNLADVEVENCDLDDVITEVNGGILKVKFRNDVDWRFWRRKNKKATITVTYTDELEVLEVSSGARIEGSNTILTGDMEIEASSGGVLQCAIDADEVQVEVSSGGVVEIAGKANAQEVEVSSGGVFKAYDLSVKFAEVEASSGGVAQVTVTEEIEADASSGGSIRYKGDPSRSKINSSYSGSIRSGK